jgi:transcriptional regulator with XRE-family HTH domain
MAFNPLDPATLRALQDLRAKTQARINIGEMTYTIPWLGTHCLYEYIDKTLGRKTKFEECEVLQALRTMKLRHKDVADYIGVTRQTVSNYISGYTHIPRGFFVKIMRVIEGAQ